MSDLNWEAEFGSDKELVISFDWHDSHSDWRLEETLPLIEETNLILARNSLPLIKAEGILDLIDLEKNYPKLYYSEQLTDSDIVQLQKNIDQISISYDTMSMDSNFEYEQIIEHVHDLIQTWSTGKKYFYLEDEWDIDPEKMFISEKESRYGLGDRWQIKFTPELIEMPSGKEIRALSHKSLAGNNFDKITDNDYCYDIENLGYIADGIQKYQDRSIEIITAVAQELNIENVLAFPTKELIENFENEIKNLNSESHFLENIIVFSKDWSGSDLELIRAAVKI